MKMNDERRKVIKELLDVTDREFTDEELIRQLTMTGIHKELRRMKKAPWGSARPMRLHGSRAAGRLSSALLQ